MKRRDALHTTLQQQLKQVERQTHVARYQLQRQVKNGEPCNRSCVYDYEPDA